MVSTFQKWWFQRWRQASLWTAKKFEDKEFEALLDEDCCQTLKRLSDTLNVTEMAASKHLNNIGLVQKAQNWLPHTKLVKRETTWKAKNDLCISAWTMRKKVFFASNFDWRWKMGLLWKSQATKSMGIDRWTRSINAKTQYSCSKGDAVHLVGSRGYDNHELLKPGKTITAVRYKQELIKLNQALKSSVQSTPNVMTN